VTASGMNSWWMPPLVVLVLVGILLMLCAISMSQFAQVVAACEARQCPDGLSAKYHPNLSDCLCVTRPK